MQSHEKKRFGNERHGRMWTYAVVLVWILGLWGCGSSNGGGGGAVAVDTTPEAFAFQALTDAELNTLYTSETITVTGIQGEAEIVILDGAGMYAINGGTFTDVAGTVREGDTVTLQLISSTDYAAMVSTTLSIGGVSAVFSVTTPGGPDTVPDTFEFTQVTDADFNKVYFSNGITVAGIEAESPISIQGGMGVYSINGGFFTNMDGTVLPGDTVMVRLTSSTEFGTTFATTLAIGGVSAVFSVSTPVFDITPDAFQFTPESNARIDYDYVSNAVIVSGITAPTTISITGKRAYYNVNNTGFTSKDGTVKNGDRVQVMMVSSMMPQTTVSATITMGGVSAVYSVTTR